MDEFITINKLITSILVAIPTAFLSVHLALKKYRTEKWWDIKLSCYLGSIKALNSLIVYCDSHLDIEFEEVSYTREQIKINESEFHVARSHLQAQVNLGELFLNKESYKAIFDFNNRLYSAERDGVQTTRIANIREVAEECVGILVDNAKKDLGVR
ncbi:hypothetical protein PSH54_02075 [Pseudoalteromonas sp. Angola-30]|uniref:hypothetical protein n=1 Tax=Pseudoalteromonas sp. Angola-30 TaxID=3025341 RepID=UPI002359A563|nr:hypothetical protein [Pseudoalteromonas sp. Angola-30]MDC9524291.1 hypothetical protein [Pseudoalteromonas sp. Angola-30]